MLLYVILLVYKHYLTKNALSTQIRARILSYNDPIKLNGNFYSTDKLQSIPSVFPSRVSSFLSFCSYFKYKFELLFVTILRLFQFGPNTVRFYRHLSFVQLFAISAPFVCHPFDGGG